MKIENKIALRYLKSRNRNSLLSFLSIISVVGIMLGVATLIVVISVMTGFTDNLKSKLLGANSDIIITRFDNQGVEDLALMTERLSKYDIVRASSPFVLSQALLNSNRNVTGVVIKGIDPLREKEVSNLSSFIIENKLEELTRIDETTHNLPQIFLGRELASTLGVTVGDNVSLISPYSSRGPFGIAPKTKRFIVGALFDTGISEYNSSMAYISVTAAQSFFEMKSSVTGISVAVKKGVNLDKAALTLTTDLGYPYWVRNWLSMNISLFSALEVEKYAMFVVLTLIIIVASFNIVSMIAITVKDKRRDIAILKAFGASSKSIKRIFITQGLFVGLLGTLLGDIIALIISVVLQNFKIIEIPKDIYFSDTIPVEISLSVYIVVTLAAFAITFCAAIFPSHQASKMNVIDGLRND